MCTSTGGPIASTSGSTLRLQDYRSAYAGRQPLSTPTAAPRARQQAHQPRQRQASGTPRLPWLQHPQRQQQRAGTRFCHQSWWSTELTPLRPHPLCLALPRLPSLASPSRASPSGRAFASTPRLRPPTLPPAPPPPPLLLPALLLSPAPLLPRPLPAIRLPRAIGSIRQQAFAAALQHRQCVRQRQQRRLQQQQQRQRRLQQQRRPLRQRSRSHHHHHQRHQRSQPTHPRRRRFNSWRSLRWATGCKPRTSSTFGEMQRL